MKKFLLACAVILALPAFASVLTYAQNMLTDTVPAKTLTDQLMRVGSSNASAIPADRSHLLVADEDGRLTGQVVKFDAAAKSMKVFFIRNGSVAKNAITDSNGYFEVTGLESGPYTFVASGSQGFVAHGTWVTTGVVGAGDQVISMHTAAIAPTFENITKFMETHRPGSSVAVNPNEDVDAMELSAIEGGNRIQITKEGVLEGRLIALPQKLSQALSFKGTSAQLTNSEKASVEIEIAEDGSFAVKDFEPGVYDLVATGPHGMAAISFEAIAWQDALTGEQPNIFQASFGSGQLFHRWCRSLDVCLAPAIDCGIVQEQLVYADQCCREVVEEVVYEEPLPVEDICSSCATGCNTGCGGGYGGGGGGAYGGGMGDWGGIIGAALGAWVLTEAFNNSNNNSRVIQPPVVIPPATSPF